MATNPTFARLAMAFQPSGLLGQGVLTPEEEEELRRLQELQALQQQPPPEPPPPEPAPVEERQYNIEDLIREQGMTPQEAYQFLKDRGQAPAEEPLQLAEAQPIDEKPLVKPKAGDDKPLVKPKTEEQLAEDAKPLVKEQPPLVKPQPRDLLAEGSMARQLLDEQQKKMSDGSVPVDQAAYDDILYKAINGPMWNSSAEEMTAYADALAKDVFGGKVGARADKEYYEDIVLARANGATLPSQLAKSKGEREGETADDFAGHLTKGAYSTAGMLWGGLEALGEASGMEGKKLAANRQYYNAISDALPQGMQASQVRSFGDALLWAQQSAAENLPNLAVSIATSGAGGVLSGTLGAQIGAFGPSFLMETGSIQQANKELNPDQKAGLATILGGGAAGALDSALPGMIGTKLVQAVGAEAAEEIAKRMLLMPAKEFAKGAATEASTEALQQAVEELATAKETGTEVKPGLFVRMFDAAAAGAILGGPAAGVTATGEAAGPSIKERLQQRLAARELANAEYYPSGQAITRGMSPSQGDVEAAPRTSVATLKQKIRQIESGGKDSARSTTSSASGRYQFTDGTWIALGGDLSKKNDPAEQERMMNKLVAQNAAALERAGVEQTAGNMYLAHFLGSGGAVQALANPDAPVNAVVQRANPFTRGWTNAQLAAWADKKMGGNGAPEDFGGRGATPDIDEDLGPVEDDLFEDTRIADEEGGQGQEALVEPPAPAPLPPKPSAGVQAVADALAGSPVADTDAIAEEMFSRLDQAKAANPVRAEQIRVQSQQTQGPAFSEDQTSQPAEEPIYDESQENIVGYLNTQTGEERPVETGTEDFVAVPQPAPQAPPQLPEAPVSSEPSEAQVVFDRMAPLGTDVDQDRAIARYTGRAVALGLEPEPEDLGNQPVYYRTAYNIGVREAENAARDAGLDLQPQEAEAAPPQAAPEPAPEPAFATATETSPSVADQLDKIDDKLFDLETEGTKAQVKRYAQSLVKKGILDQQDVDALAPYMKDRDMGVEDLTSEIRTSVQIWADRRSQPRGMFAGGTSEPAEEAAPAVQSRVRNADQIVSQRLDRHGRGAPRSYARQSAGTDRSNGRVATFTPTDEFTSGMAEAGYPAVTLHELRPTSANAERFRDAIQKSKEASPYGAAVYVYSPGEYMGMRMFLNEDGTAGLAIKPDGDIVSVFSDGGGKVHSMLAMAVENGGTKLDAFDTVLPDIYSVNGFKIVARDKWDDQYMPEGWDKETFSVFNNGEPDVVYMEYDPNYSPFAADQPAKKEAPKQKAEPKPEPKPKPQAAEKTSREIGRERQDSREALKAYKLNIHKQVLEIYKEMGLEGLVPVEIVGALENQDWAGVYDPRDRFIRIAAMNNLNLSARHVARHEIIHWAVDHGLWDGKEWALLKKWAQAQPGLMAWARKNYPKPAYTEEEILEEAVAEGFARWDNGKLQLKEPDSAIAKLFQKLKDMIDGVRKAFARSGVSRGELRKAIDLLSEFETGKRARKLRGVSEKPTFGRRPWNDDLSREMLSGNITPEQHHFLSQMRGPRFQSGWHGSPNENIDKFSLQYIGQGEGAQAFGWGLYFAQKKAVAEWYQRKLTMQTNEPVDQIIQVNGQSIRQWSKDRFGNDPYRNVAAYEVADRLFSFLSTNKPYNGWLGGIHASIQNEIDRWIADNKRDGNAQEAAELARMQEHIDDIFLSLERAKVDQKEIPHGGKLYQVEVPENEDLIDLDKRLSEQSPQVQKGIRRIIEDMKAVNAEILGVPVEEMDPRDIMDFSGLTFTRVIMPNVVYNIPQSSTWLAKQSEELQNAVDADAVAMATSIWMRDAGIPGARYLDRDSRIPETEAEGPKTANFVIFDDNLIQLKAKYRVVKSTVANTPLSDPTQPDPSIWRRIHDQTMGLLGALAHKDVDAADNLVDAFRRKVTQRYQQIIKTQRRAAQLLGVDRLASGQNPMEMITADERGYKLSYITENMIKPMARELAQRGISMQDLGLYLYARHAPARNARIARINKAFSTPNNPGSGMSDVEAQQIMANFAAEGRIDDLDAAASYIDMMIQYAQQERLAAGLISQQDVANGFQPGDFYVPLRGNESIEPELEMDFGTVAKKGGGFSVAGKESHRMFGRASKADLEQIVGYSITQAQEAVDRAYRNRVGQSMLEMFRAVPDPDFVKIDRVKRVAVRNSKTGQIEYQMQKRIVDPEEQLRTIYVKENGHVTKLTFNNKNPSAMRFVKAAKNLGIEALPSFLRWMSLYTRLWTKSNTQWNIDFILANAARDIQTGVLNASTLDQKGLRRAMLKNIASMRALRGAWWGAHHAPGAGEGTGKKWRELYAEFEANGGKLDYGEVQPIEDAIKDAQKAIKRAERGRFNALSGAQNVMEWIDRANSSFENMTRLAAYGALRDAGIPAKRAAEAVRELTTNFQQHGEWGPKFNAAYGFANASMVGGARFAYTMLKKPHIAAGLIGLGMLTDMINSLWDKDEWDKYSEEDKHTNFMLLLPEEFGFDIKFPIGYGINAFTTLGRKMSELWRGKKKEDGTAMGIWDAATDAALGFANSFSPITGSNLWNIITPSVGDPIVDIYRNQNAWGRPIMPPQALRKEKEVPDSQLAFENTGQFWKTLATTMNALGGGNDVIPGWTPTDISPESYKHLAEETVGGAGRSFFRTYKMLENWATGGDVGPNDIPVIRRFAGNPYGAANAKDEQQSAFYERLNTSRTVIAQAKELVQRYGKDSPVYQDFRKDNEPIIDFADKIELADKKLRALNTAENAAERGEHRISGLNKRDRNAVHKATGIIVPHRTLTAEEVAKIKLALKEKKQALSARFNELWLENVMKESAEQ